MENIIAEDNVIIISGPSASGKSALLQYLLSKRPEYRQVHINEINQSGKDDVAFGKVVYIAEEIKDANILKEFKKSLVDHPDRSSNPLVFVTQLRTLGHLGDYHIDCEAGFRFRLSGRRHGIVKLYGPDYQEIL